MVWRPFYSADKIAESYDEPAPVPALQFQGRRVVITGGVYHGRHAKGHGWAVAAAEDWHGPTYSYRSQCRAWNEGRKERGDQRGLLVRVDRQLCVLAEYVEFVDENDTSHPQRWPALRDQAARQIQSTQNTLEGLLSDYADYFDQQAADRFGGFVMRGIEPDAGLPAQGDLF